MDWCVDVGPFLTGGDFMLPLRSCGVYLLPMMKILFLIPLFAGLVASAVRAQTPAAPQPEPPLPVILTPAQTVHILKELEKAESLIGKGRGGLFGTALGKFREAMASDTAALALYLDCYRLEHFERKNLKQSDFMDWRNRNELRLKDSDFKKGLLLQIEYLVLSIQAQDIDEDKKLAPLVASLQAFLGKAITAVQGSTKHSASGAVGPKDAPGGKGGGRRGGGGGAGGDIVGVLRQAVGESEFANAYQLADYLNRKEWEYSPLDIDGIYQKIIFPYYLAEKSSELPAQWEARINAEMALRHAVLSETEYNLFVKDEMPRRQWEKNIYLVSHNVSAVNAMADLLKVIQNNPNHPDAVTWLKDFRELVKKVSEPGPGTPPVEKPIGSP